MEEERRKFVRLNALTDVVYSRSENLEIEKLSLTRNISEGGICLIAYEQFKVSDILNLDIYIPELKVPIHAVGRVAWVKEFIVGDIARGKRYDLGIEFLEIDDKDRERIEHYVFKRF